LAALKEAFTLASGYSELSTIVVTIGVAIEFVALFAFSKEMPRSEKIVMGVATALIVLGCGGEYIFGSRATSAALQLQNSSDLQIAETKMQAQSAVAAAASLGVSFGDLDQFVKDKTIEFNAATNELKRDTKDLNKSRDDALKAAQESKKILVKMDAILDQERTVQQQMADAIKPRTLSPEQRSMFVKRMKAFHGVKVNVWRFQTTSTDSDIFSREIIGLLHESQWEVNGVSIAVSGSTKGVVVLKRVGSNSHIEHAVSALVSELKNDKIPSIDGGDFSGDGISMFGNSSFNTFSSNPDIIIVIGDKQ
jgi:hypothetical protein